jgi:hypothetical protein
MKADFKIGEQVFDSVFYPEQKGVVIDVIDASISTDGLPYVVVNFPDIKHKKWYTPDGRHNSISIVTLSKFKYSVLFDFLVDYD